jgi:hypothetical protein
LAFAQSHTSCTRTQVSRTRCSRLQGTLLTLSRLLNTGLQLSGALSPAFASSPRLPPPQSLNPAPSRWSEDVKHYVMGRPSLPQSTPGSVGLSGSRLLYPNEYQLSQLGIHTKWTARVDEKRISKLRVLPSPKEWWKAVLDLRERTPLLLRFSRELAQENGRSFWVLLALNICQACIPSCECSLVISRFDVS